MNASKGLNLASAALAFTLTQSGQTSAEAQDSQNPIPENIVYFEQVLDETRADYRERIMDLTHTAQKLNMEVTEAIWDNDIFRGISVIQTYIRLLNIVNSVSTFSQTGEDVKLAENLNTFLERLSLWTNLDRSEFPDFSTINPTSPSLASLGYFGDPLEYPSTYTHQYDVQGGPHPCLVQVARVNQDRDNLERILDNLDSSQRYTYIPAAEDLHYLAGLHAIDELQCLDYYPSHLSDPTEITTYLAQTKIPAIYLTDLDILDQVMTHPETILVLPRRNQEQILNSIYLWSEYGDNLADIASGNSNPQYLETLGPYHQVGATMLIRLFTM